MSFTFSEKQKKYLRWLPGVLISAIALYAVFKVIHFQDLQSAFSAASWQFALIIFILDVASMMIRGKAWQCLLGNKIPWTQAFFGVSEGYLLNNLFPFRAGEIGRSIFVGRSSGLGMFHVLSTIVIERAFDVFFAAVLLLGTLPLIVGVEWVKTVAMIALVLVVTCLIGLFLVARNKEKVAFWIEKHGKRWNFVEKHIVPQIRKLLDGLSALTNPKQFLASFFWIGLTWGFWVVIYGYMMKQILPTAPLWNGAFIGSLLALGVAIPSAPAAIGVYEASMVAAVVILKGNESTALAFALIMHFFQFVSSGIFGFWGLAREGQSLSKVFSRISSAQQKNDEGILETDN